MTAALSIPLFADLGKHLCNTCLFFGYIWEYEINPQTTSTQRTETYGYCRKKNHTSKCLTFSVHVSSTHSCQVFCCAKWPKLHSEDLFEIRSWFHWLPEEIVIYQNSSEATAVNYAEIAEFVYNQIIIYIIYVYRYSSEIHDERERDSK